MVQVDVFWSFGIGSGLALAAHRQIKAAQQKSMTAWQSALHSPYFSMTLLFLSLVFVPSGIWLLWQFSSWETMHAGTRDLPVWLVGLFAFTNMSQGVLGYLIAQQLIWRDKIYHAWLSFLAAYFGMFFILVHGWDGKGYQRFLSADRQEFEQWTWLTAKQWLQSDVAFTLYGMGIILIPILSEMTLHWVRVGALQDGFRAPRSQVLNGFGGSVFVISLGLAIFASVSLIMFGWLVGSVLSGLGIFLALHPRLGWGRWFYRAMTQNKPSV